MLWHHYLYSSSNKCSIQTLNNSPKCCWQKNKYRYSRLTVPADPLSFHQFNNCGYAGRSIRVISGNSPRNTLIVNRHQWLQDITYSGIADEQVERFIFKASKQKVSLAFFRCQKFPYLKSLKIGSAWLQWRPARNLFWAHARVHVA